MEAEQGSQGWWCEEEVRDRGEGDAKTPREAPGGATQVARGEAKSRGESMRLPSRGGSL